jgi:DNA modification methylase
MTIRIHIGDCREVLASMAAESVHMVCTSPPYWGLRDYGVPPTIWGNPECAHEWGNQIVSNDPKDRYRRHTLAWQSGGQPSEIKNATQGAFCRCGAWRGALGLEPTYTAYVEHVVEVFRAVWRVLRPDGTLWLNLGSGYQDKQLDGVPWRVAFALQADGWWLRQDIIYSKPNPMPESITDRCTKAHEYLFMLTKSARYFYDAEAIKEPAVAENEHDLTGQGYFAPGQTPHRGNRGRASGNKSHKGVAEYERSDSEEHRTKAGLLNIASTAYAMRNKRSVWEIATQSFPDAHFATMPPALVEPCILAGTSARGCCAKCGVPLVRDIKRVDKGWDGSKYGEATLAASGGVITGGTAISTLGSGNGKLVGQRETLGWAPSCKCDAAVVPCTVLDPFFGAGTVGLVADRLQRNCVGIELNPAYATMAERRIESDGGMFANVDLA